MNDAEKIRIMREALWAIVAKPILDRTVAFEVKELQAIASDALIAADQELEKVPDNV